jgi:hypothetical protein
MAHAPREISSPALPAPAHTGSVDGSVKVREASIAERCAVAEKQGAEQMPAIVLIG